MRPQRFCASALLCTALIGFSSNASATVVAEVNPNGTLATAQNLDGNFSTDANGNITNSTTIPHATVVSEGRESAYDYYSFTVALAGSNGIFDIDFGLYESEDDRSGDFDPFLSLLDSNGSVLATNDDASVDPGSFHPYDSYLTYNFASAGTYAIRVGSCCEAPLNGDYQLQVSLEAPGATGAVPEPATWAMMLIGFGAIGASVRRSRKASGVPQAA